MQFELVPPTSRRLVHFTPLRYPGGKGKLAAYVKKLMSDNHLLDGEYVEPYAGGAAIALELLFHEYASRVHINDLSRPIYTFWDSVLNRTDALCKLIFDTPLTPDAWAQQKKIFSQQSEQDDLALAFSTFYLNRTNRSGILNGGIIGGLDQSGPWKIDARFNREELIYRIECIARLKSRINLTRTDALEFLKFGISDWPKKTLIYLDPPYFVKGRHLYYDFYKADDHKAVADFVTAKMPPQNWIVSYDNVPEIRELYKGSQRIVYEIGYSARQSSPGGKEVMFFSDVLQVPPLVGPLKIVKGAGMTKQDDEHYSAEEAQERFEAALRASKVVGHKPMKSMTKAARASAGEAKAKKKVTA